MYFQVAGCSLEKGLSYTISCDGLSSSYLEIFLCPNLLKDWLNGMYWAEARAFQCAPGTYLEQTQPIMVCPQKLLCLASPRANKQLSHAYPKCQVWWKQRKDSLPQIGEQGPAHAGCWEFVGIVRGEAEHVRDCTLSCCACVQGRLRAALGWRLADVGVADWAERRNFGMFTPLQ